MTLYDSDILVDYSATNENLEAIISGLVPSSEDSILAIGGSGDQAFALLEFSRNVEAVDISPSQINFIQGRIEALKKRDYNQFFRIHPDDFTLTDANRRAYFLGLMRNNRARLEAIRVNLHNLVITPPQDIFKMPNNSKFSKIYLSNALGFTTNDLVVVKKQLRKVAQRIDIGGLIYVANHDRFIKLSKPYLNKKLDPFQDLIFLPKELKIERELSQKARDLEMSWGPAVYRRIE